MSLERINVIDALGLDEASGRVVLVIRNDAPWDGSDAQLYLLQEKLNAYLSFALDGEMADAHPEFNQRPLAVRLDCIAPPDVRTLHLLGHVRQQLAFQDVPLDVRVVEAVSATPSAHGCGGGCGCH